MLRRFGLALICGCCCWLAGCQAAKSGQRPANAYAATVVSEKTAGSIELFLALVQAPLNDSFLSELPETDCLWSCTDHHVANFERQILLEENGYRVGQIVGMIPAQLITLLNSPRTCIDPRCRILTYGERTILPLGPALPRSTFTLKNAGLGEQYNVDQARHCLEVVARLNDDGRIKLEFTPRVERASSAFPIDLAADLSGYVHKFAPPHQSFPSLSWHIVLKPGETLVIGPNLEKPDSLGCRSLTLDDGINRYQRVLVLRTSRSISPDSDR